MIMNFMGISDYENTLLVLNNRCYISCSQRDVLVGCNKLFQLVGSD